MFHWLGSKTTSEQKNKASLRWGWPASALAGKEKDWGLFLSQDWKFSGPGNPHSRTSSVSQRQTSLFCRDKGLAGTSSPGGQFGTRSSEGGAGSPRVPSVGRDWAPHQEVLSQLRALRQSRLSQFRAFLIVFSDSSRAMVRCAAESKPGSASRAPKGRTTEGPHPEGRVGSGGALAESYTSRRTYR